MKGLVIKIQHIIPQTWARSRTTCRTSCPSSASVTAPVPYSRPLSCNWSDRQDARPGAARRAFADARASGAQAAAAHPRSEEHTSELQSLMRISYAVFCLKKKKNKHK